MKKKQTDIIFVRHGETDMNKEGLYFGHLNPELNNTGRLQIEKTRKLLKYFEKDINVAISSDLVRCTETMEILKLNKKIKKNTDTDFREMNFGIFEGKSYNDILKEYPKEMKLAENDWQNFKIPNGESLNEVMNRVIEKLGKIIKKYKNKKIIIITHAGVIRTVVSYYLYGNLNGYWKIKINNGSLTKICILEDEFVYFDYINRF